MSKLQVKIKRTHPNAKIPKYAKPGDAGLDVACIDVKETYSYVEYNTGLCFEIPEGYVGLLFPRSSNTTKDLILGNSVGVIDSSYRGEVTFRYKRIGAMMSMYSVGDRIGQIIILPYPQVQFNEVDSLTETERGTGGYGSSGS
jgi:dUTP pyrophosphatase